MAQVYFHYFGERGAMLDGRRADVEDLDDLRAQAIRTIHSLVTAPTLEDWRNWVLLASDDLGQEVFVLPFLSLLGRPH